MWYPEKEPSLKMSIKIKKKQKKRPLTPKGSKWASGGTKYNEITFFCLGSKNSSSGGIHSPDFFPRSD